MDITFIMQIDRRRERVIDPQPRVPIPELDDGLPSEKGLRIKYT